MNTFERRRKIVELVNDQGSLMVNDISGQLGVTEVTIRADLRLLEEKGLLTRFHGGAACIRHEAAEPEAEPYQAEVSLSDRYQLASLPKKRIAMAAAGLVAEGDTVILDSGSTTKLIAEELMACSNITVITNNLPAAFLLAENKDITLVVCGGTLRHKTSSLHGSIAEYALRDVSANLMFVGADGLDSDNGITTFNEGFAISSIMAQAAHRVVVVTDASKFGRKGFNQVLPLEKIDTIITDDAAPEAVLAQLRARGKSLKVV